jgi:hypothetical protein
MKSNDPFSQPIFYVFAGCHVIKKIASSNTNQSEANIYTFEIKVHSDNVKNYPDFGVWQDVL